MLAAADVLDCCSGPPPDTELLCDAGSVKLHSAVLAWSSDVFAAMPGPTSSDDSQLTASSRRRAASLEPAGALEEEEGRAAHGAYTCSISVCASGHRSGQAVGPQLMHICVHGDSAAGWQLVKHHLYPHDVEPSLTLERVAHMLPIAHKYNITRVLTKCMDYLLSSTASMQLPMQQDVHHMYGSSSSSAGSYGNSTTTAINQMVSSHTEGTGVGTANGSGSIVHDPSQAVQCRTLPGPGSVLYWLVQGQRLQLPSLVHRCMQVLLQRPMGHINHVQSSGNSLGSSSGSSGGIAGSSMLADPTAIGSAVAAIGSSTSAAAVATAAVQQLCALCGVQTGSGTAAAVANGASRGDESSRARNASGSDLRAANKAAQDEATTAAATEVAAHGSTVVGGEHGLLSELLIALISTAARAEADQRPGLVRVGDTSACSNAFMDWAWAALPVAAQHALLPVLTCITCHAPSLLLLEGEGRPGYGQRYVLDWWQALEAAEKLYCSYGLGAAHARVPVASTSGAAGGGSSSSSKQGTQGNEVLAQIAVLRKLCMDWMACSQDELHARMRHRGIGEADPDDTWSMPWPSASTAIVLQTQADAGSSSHASTSAWTPMHRHGQRSVCSGSTMSAVPPCTAFMLSALPSSPHYAVRWLLAADLHGHRALAQRCILYYELSREDEAEGASPFMQGCSALGSSSAYGSSSTPAAGSSSYSSYASYTSRYGTNNASSTGGSGTASGIGASHATDGPFRSYGQLVSAYAGSNPSNTISSTQYSTAGIGRDPWRSSRSTSSTPRLTQPCLRQALKDAVQGGLSAPLLERLGTVLLDTCAELAAAQMHTGMGMGDGLYDEWGEGRAGGAARLLRAPH